MKDRENDINFGKEDDSQFVIADNGNPLTEPIRRLMSRAVTRERIAMWAQIKSLEDEVAESEAPASELWREMPELAREHESLRGDDGLSADDWEFDGFSGVTA